MKILTLLQAKLNAHTITIKVSKSEFRINQLFMLANFWFFVAKIVVFTGDTLENGKYAEIIDLSNPNAVCDPYVVLENGTYYSSGGRISKNDYIYCGGSDGNNRLKECYILGENSPFAELLNPQTSGSSVVLPNSTLFITGKCFAFL